MINFNENSGWDLYQISFKDVVSEVKQLLIPGEQLIMAFRTVRDQLVFTNKRIISIDIQGITGTKKSYASMPYSKISYFTIQTPRMFELVPDSELELMFANGFKAHFEFRGSVDIGAVERMIATYVLG